MVQTCFSLVGEFHTECALRAGREAIRLGVHPRGGYGGRRRHIAEQGGSISDMGEWGIIAALTGGCRPGRDMVGIGDDAAVVGAPSGSVVAAVDFLLEGRHFRGTGRAPTTSG